MLILEPVKDHKCALILCKMEIGWLFSLKLTLSDRQTDKYFISRSGQTIDIEQNLQIQLQIETWHSIDKIWRVCSVVRASVGSGREKRRGIVQIEGRHERNHMLG